MNFNCAAVRVQAHVVWNTVGQFAADTFVFTPLGSGKSIPITAAQ